jgi:hypothetical protein
MNPEKIITGPRHSYCEGEFIWITRVNKAGILKAVVTEVEKGRIRQVKLASLSPTAIKLDDFRVVATQAGPPLSERHK